MADLKLNKFLKQKSRATEEEKGKDFNEKGPHKQFEIIKEIESEKRARHQFIKKINYKDTPQSIQLLYNPQPFRFESYILSMDDDDIIKKGFYDKLPFGYIVDENNLLTCDLKIYVDRKNNTKNNPSKRKKTIGFKIDNKAKPFERKRKFIERRQNGDNLNLILNEDKDGNDDSDSILMGNTDDNGDDNSVQSPNDNKIKSQNESSWQSKLKKIIGDEADFYKK